MTTSIPLAEARNNLSELVNRVAFGKERVLLSRHGKDLAVLVPVGDARLLEGLDAEVAAEQAWPMGQEWMRTALRILEAVIDLMPPRGGCTATNKEIAERAGIRSDSTVRDKLRWWRALGVIEIVGDTALPSGRRIRLR